MELCTWLRWKGAKNQRDNPQLLAWIFSKNTVPYTCLKNCQSTGPDGKLVAPESCGKHRSCFVAYKKRGDQT